MKKYVLILALALGLILLAACGAEDLVDVLAPNTPEAAPTEPVMTMSPEDDSDTDITVLPDGEIVSDSDTDTSESAGGFSYLTAAECIEDAWDFEGVLPRITVECEGAAAINERIAEEFTELANDPMVEVHYEVYKGAERVLSVVMVEQVNDSVFYTPYNLDLVTGEAITGPELLELLEVDEKTLIDAELQVLGEEFTHQFGGLLGNMDQDFYDGQYERTTAGENAELEKLWLGAQGQLCFAGRIYPMAGAEYYEYPFGTGLIF